MMPVGKKNSSLLPVIALILTAVFFSFNIIIGKKLVTAIPPFTLAFWRWFLVFILYGLINLKPLKKNLTPILKDYKKLFLLGFLGMFASGGFIYTAAQTTTATNIALIYTSSPIIIVLINHYFFKLELNNKQIVGVILGFIGVCSIIFKLSITNITEFKLVTGDILVLISSVSWAIYSIIQTKKNTSLNTSITFLGTCAAGAFLLFPITLIENDLFVIFKPEYLLYLFVLVIFPSLIAFRLYLYVQDQLGSNTASLILYLVPIFNAFFAHLLLNEGIKNYHIIGAVITFSGVYLATKKK